MQTKVVRLGPWLLYQSNITLCRCQTHSNPIPFSNTGCPFLTDIQSKRKKGKIKFSKTVLFSEKLFCLSISGRFFKKLFNWYHILEACINKLTATKTILMAHPGAHIQKDITGKFFFVREFKFYVMSQVAMLCSC